MIKLKILLREEKEAFRLEKEGKIAFTMNSYESDKMAIQLTVDGHPMGKIQIWPYVPYEDLGSPPPKPRYMFVSDIFVFKKGEGYGYFLYREALKYAQKMKFRGLVSSKLGRQPDADNMWSKLKTFEDKYYDYVDIKDLGTKVKESLFPSS